MKNIYLSDFLSRYGSDISQWHDPAKKDISDYPSYYWVLCPKDSFAFITLCAYLFVPITRGDIYEIIDDSLYYTGVSWHYSRADNECFTFYLEHSVNKAAEFIRNYSSKDNMMISFYVAEEI